MMVQGVKVDEKATPSNTLEQDVQINGIDALIAQFDVEFAAFQKVSKMGDYVKFDEAADMFLNLRNKANSLRN